MTKNLAKLISEYQWYIASIVNLLKVSQIPTPRTASEWAEKSINPIFYIDVGVKFIKHGYGCTVHSPNKTINFDFGKNGELDGFDLYRLMEFSKNNLDEFGYKCKEEIEEDFKSAESTGSIYYSGYLLYYIKDSLKNLSDEALKEINKNHLPNIGIDSINRLYSSCHLSADLMRENYIKLHNKMESCGLLSINEKVEFRIYFLTWIGYLKETSEGFEKLNIRNLIIKKRPDYFNELIPIFDAINSVYSKIRKRIVQLRNDIFHFKKNNESIDNFFSEGVDILEQCNYLHKSNENFFSTYRILCEVHYFKNNRINESQINK